MVPGGEHLDRVIDVFRGPTKLDRTELSEARSYLVSPAFC